MIRDTVTSLALGTPSQQDAASCLQQLNVGEVLAAYQPRLVGTVPLDIHIPGSDLDIICEVYELASFLGTCRAAFGHYPGYYVKQTIHQGMPATVLSFQTSRWPIEIFGQPIPTHQQYAYRHMVIEGNLLRLAGSEMAEWVRSQKGKGIKTEPAFALMLGLTGDPYEGLLDLESYTEEQLIALIPAGLRKRFERE